MSNEEWAFKNIVRFQLCVDFYANTITDPENELYYWQGRDIKDFYEVLNEVIQDQREKEEDQ